MYVITGDIAYRGVSDDPHKIKEQFREAFNYAVKGTEYDFPENSSSVLTIKCKDKKNNCILHSCDLAIVYYDSYGSLHYLEQYKSHNILNSNGYGFPCRNFPYDYEKKIDEIYDARDDWWELISAEYLKLKNSNIDPCKKSFILYVEAVNNIYDQYVRRNDCSIDLYPQIYKRNNR